MVDEAVPRGGYLVLHQDPHLRGDPLLGPVIGKFKQDYLDSVAASTRESARKRMRAEQYRLERDDDDDAPKDQPDQGSEGSLRDDSMAITENTSDKDPAVRSIETEVAQEDSTTPPPKTWADIEETQENEDDDDGDCVLGTAAQSSALIVMQTKIEDLTKQIGYLTEANKRSRADMMELKRSVFDLYSIRIRNVGGNLTTETNSTLMIKTKQILTDCGMGDKNVIENICKVARNNTVNVRVWFRDPDKVDVIMSNSRKVQPGYWHGGKGTTKVDSKAGHVLKLMTDQSIQVKKMTTDPPFGGFMRCERWALRTEVKMPDHEHRGRPAPKVAGW